jgi:hypothetical protein
MSLPVTNQQRLSMTRAEEGIKLLRGHIASLDGLGELVPALDREGANMRGFREAAIDQAKALKKSKNDIFYLAGWKGSSEEAEKLQRASGRVEHCGTAIAYSARKQIIESALAEAKDLIEQCIDFLDGEAHRFPEKTMVLPAPELSAAKVEKREISTKPQTKFTDVFTFKLPFGFGTVDPIKLSQWIKERWR